MEHFKAYCDLITFEIRYSDGHLYWDRCGQTLADIEKEGDGWFSMEDPKQTGQIENPEKNFILTFSNLSFSFNARKPLSLTIDELLKEIKFLWKIVRSNFGIEIIDRFGLRLHYLKPSLSIEDSEKYIKNSKFNIVIPDNLNAYNLKIRQAIGIFEKDDIEYRAEIKGITRSEAIDPKGLHRGNIRSLSKKQKEYRNFKMKQFADYSINPMYGAMLDVDCSKMDPENLTYKDFIKNCYSVVNEDFFPILEE